MPHPLEHTDLYTRIIQAGEGYPGNVILSEYGPKELVAMSPKYYDRNRITTWMSGVVLTHGIERANSGAIHSVILARHAQIPVFFIAGTVSQDAAAKLAMLGAGAVNSPDQMVELLQKK